MPPGLVYQAVLQGDAPGLDTALKRGGDVNERNEDNRWTSLMLAVASDRPDLVERLLREPTVDVNARSDRGQTALHLAAEGGSERLVDFLLRHPNVDLNAKDTRGWTPLTTAAFANRTGVLRRLLSRRDLAVNSVDQDRQTALHWAVLAGHLEAVRALLEHPQVNVAITNRPAGQTAYETARSMGLEAIAEALNERGRSGELRDELAPGEVYVPRDLEAEPGIPMTKFIPEPPRRRSKP